MTVSAVWLVRKVEENMGKNKDKKQGKDKAAKTSEVAGRPRRNRKGKDTRTELARLQVELAHLQAWVKKSGARIVIIFEGRDAAGKAA